MGLFYDGEGTPSDEVVKADVFQLVRYGGKKEEIIRSIRDHFKGNASNEQIQKAFKSLLKE